MTKELLRAKNQKKCSETFNEEILMILSSKMITQFVSKIQEFEGHFHCDPNTPTSVVKEMLFDFLKIIGQIEDHQLQKQKEAEETEKKNANPDISPDKISSEAQS